MGAKAVSIFWKIWDVPTVLPRWNAALTSWMMWQRLPSLSQPNSFASPENVWIPWFLRFRKFVLLSNLK